MSSWVEVEIFSNPDSHGPGGRSRDPTSARYRRFEARPVRCGAVRCGELRSLLYGRAMDQGGLVHFDPIWRRIVRDAFHRQIDAKLEGRVTRLEELNNWGALSWAYPHAKASKREHNLGVVRNATAFIAASEARRKFEVSLRIAAHALHWGHLPLSYQGAEGLLRAAHVDTRARAALTQVAKEVAEFGGLTCDARSHSCLDAIRTPSYPFELYRWLSAWIVVDDWKKLWQAAKSAATDEPAEDDTKRAVMRALVCREDPGYKLLTLCDKADFVPRDLLQSGTAWLTVDIETIWEHSPLGQNAAASGN